MSIPSDPFMLLSYVNTKLRDEYNSLEELCSELGIDQKEIEQKLQEAGFEYNETQNKFW